MATNSLHQLPLRLLGLKHIPAIPVTLDGLLGSLVRLGIRAEKVKQAAHGLNNVYTILALRHHSCLQEKRRVSSQKRYLKEKPGANLCSARGGKTFWQHGPH